MHGISLAIAAISNIMSVYAMILPTMQFTGNLTLDGSTATFDADLPRFRNSTGGAAYPDGAVWDAGLIQRVVTLGILIVATFVGNTIIVVVLSRSRYMKRHSRVNVFILNLAIGDLLVCCITMTSELLFEVFGGWVLGPEACKIIVYAQIVTLASTTFILTTMSYDRYLAICSPLHSTGGAKQAKRMIAASWILAFILAIPQLFIFVQEQTGITESGKIRYECISTGYTASWQRKVYFSWLTIYIFIVPACCISYCYVNVLRAVWAAGKENNEAVSMGAVHLRRSVNANSAIPRAKIKTLKLTVCIIASFIICWTPYFIVHNVRIFSDYSINIPKFLVVASENLALVNSALNPIFYGYFNVALRTGFKEIVYKKKDNTNHAVRENCNGKVESEDYSYSSSLEKERVSATSNFHEPVLTECGSNLMIPNNHVCGGIRMNGSLNNKKRCRFAETHV